MPVARPAALPRWGSLLPRQPSTYYAPGERFTNGGNIYQVHAVTGGGTTDAGAGYTGTGSNQADGTCHVDYIATQAPAYSGGTYAAGYRATNVGNLYEVVSPGGGASSVAPTGFGQITTADGYTWIYLASSNAVDTQPTAYQQDIGWIPIWRPPAQIFNWLLWVIYRWLLFLDQETTPAYGSIYRGYNNGGITLPAPPDASHSGAYTEVKDAPGPIPVYFADGTCVGVTADHANGRLTVAKGGLYRVQFNGLLFDNDSSDIHYTFWTICKNGVTPTVGNIQNTPYFYQPNELSAQGITGLGVGATMAIDIDGYIALDDGDHVSLFGSMGNYAGSMHTGDVGFLLQRLVVQRVGTLPS